MNESKPLVTIAVFSYNTARFAPHLYRSLQAQTYQNFEVLVFEDGSTDTSIEVLSPFLKDQRFRLISWKKNRGFGWAMSTALERISGEYYVLIGADDELQPDFLKQRVTWMEEHPQVGFMHGAVELIDEKGEPLTETSPLAATVTKMRLIQEAMQQHHPSILLPEEALRLLLQHNVVYAPSAFLRTSTTRRLTPHVQMRWNFASDWFLWLMHASTGMVAYDPTPLTRYRVHGASMSHNPRHNASKQAEIRLIPLCALAIAAEVSFDAASLWATYRKMLYAQWLRRAVQLQRAGQLQDAWLQMGALAYYGRGRNPVSLPGELFRHATSVLRLGWEESRAGRQQWFRVSGLSQVNHPFFALKNQPDMEVRRS